MVFQINPGDREAVSNLKTRASTHTVGLLKRQWLSDKAFEIMISSPSGFEFEPGQRICLNHDDHERDYSIVSAPQEPDLTLCVRNVTGGIVSAYLSSAKIGTALSIHGPYGYFTYKPSPRAAVFVATGTGIAPFCSMARAGISDFTLLHGVRLPEDLYYADQFKQNARKYVPCLTESNNLPAIAFQGKVTEYLERLLPSGAYDFYLCGRREMIRDATLLIDERFSDSLVYTEMFF
jgi:ferredoxin-NADP reductase